MRSARGFTIDDVTYRALWLKAREMQISMSYLVDGLIREALGLPELSEPKRGRATNPHSAEDRAARRRGNALLDAAAQIPARPDPGAYCTICNNEAWPGDPCPKCGN